MFLTSRAAIFIDGGYLDKTLSKDHHIRAINYRKLAPVLIADANRILGRDLDLLRVYYYHCLPFLPRNPTPDQQAFYDLRERFLRQISLECGYYVRQGRLRHRGVDRATGRDIYQQKRVDTLLTLDLTLLSTKRVITHAILIAGDADLVPPVATIKAEGVMAILYTGGPRNPAALELKQECDRSIRIGAPIVAILRDNPFPMPQWPAPPAPLPPRAIPTRP